MKKIILLFSVLLCCINTNLFADDYGTNISSVDKRYVVTAKSLNVRNSPKVGKPVMVIKEGDICYGTPVTYQENSPQSEEWLKINGGDYYVSMKWLREEKNPYYMDEESNKNTSKDVGKAHKIISGAQITLLVLIGVSFIVLLILLILFDVYNPNDGPFAKLGRRSDGMRAKFYYDYRSYLLVGTISLHVLVAILIGILLMLIIAALGWGVMALVWCFMHLILIIGWILAIGGALSLLTLFDLDDVGCGVPIIGAIVGGIGIFILHYTDKIEYVGELMLYKGKAFFNYLYIPDFVINTFMNYWPIALVSILTPIVLFLVLVILNLIVSGTFMLVEKIVMHFYNIKNPCPICQHPSEPAIYMSDGIELPVSLHPGKYGVFHIRHNITGEKMPTLLFNGKDKLERKCCNCGAIISAKMGTEKHLALAGCAESGKTTLVYRMLATIFMKYGKAVSFTDTVDSSLPKTIKEIAAKDEMKNFPAKTAARVLRSIQIILKRKASSDYRIFINDVGGELYNLSSVNAQQAQQISQFVSNISSVLFIVDPMTVDFEYLNIDPNFESWLKTQESFTEKVDIIESYRRLLELFESQKLTDKQIRKMHINVILVKKDTGYLDNLPDITDKGQLKRFIQNDMGLNNLITEIESRFEESKIHYHAVSAIQKGYGKTGSNVNNLVNDILRQFDIKNPEQHLPKQQ